MRLRSVFSSLPGPLERGDRKPSADSAPGAGLTSSAPVTEYACPFTSFWNVMASESAMLVICKRGGGVRPLDAASLCLLHRGPRHRPPAAALRWRGWQGQPGGQRAASASGQAFTNPHRTLERGWWPGLGTDPRAASGSPGARGPAQPHCGVPRGQFCACLWDLHRLYQNFLGVHPSPDCGEEGRLVCLSQSIGRRAEGTVC